MLSKSYYDILQVLPDATQEEISESYRQLARRFHPDRFVHGSRQWREANEKLKELNQAYETIRDPQKRSEYDAAFLWRFDSGINDYSRADSAGDVAVSEGNHSTSRLYAKTLVILLFLLWAVPLIVVSVLSEKSGLSSVYRPEKPAQVRSLHTNPIDRAEIILIPAGWFLRGKAGYIESMPERKIYLNAYWIYKYPVTVAQYRRFCVMTGRDMPEPPKWGWQDNHPMMNVSWEDASAYAKWAGGRLPTEAEWEKAARGTDGRTYPWGNKFDAQKCNSWYFGPRRTTAVDRYPQGASPYGVMDMAGNAREWCADWYGERYYKAAPIYNPQGPATGRFHVRRGGAFCDNRYYLRCASRCNLGFSFEQYPATGFRVVRTFRP